MRRIVLMTRTGKVVSWVAAVVVIVLIALVIFITTFDWNRLKPSALKISPVRGERQ